MLPNYGIGLYIDHVLDVKHETRELSKKYGLLPLKLIMDDMIDRFEIWLSAHKELISVILNILMIAATLFLGLIAIFGEWFKNKILGPRLEIDFAEECEPVAYLKSALTPYFGKLEPDPSSNLIVDNIEISVEAIWVRARITNAGKSLAKNCEVRLETISKNGEEIKTFDPITLHWVGFPPMIATRKEAFLDIKPHASELVDVCYIYRNDRIEARKESVIQLITELKVDIGTPDLSGGVIYDPNPTHRANLVRFFMDDKLRLKVAVFSDNARRSERIIDIGPRTIIRNTPILGGVSTHKRHGHDYQIYIYSHEL